MGSLATRDEPRAPTAADGHAIEAALQRVQQPLDALQASLAARDLPGIEQHANELQRALTRALDDFSRAARRGGLPLPWRQRLTMATAQVSAQRDALARASAALGRAIGVLMPGHGSAVYSASGNPQHLRGGTSLEA